MNATMKEIKNGKMGERIEALMKKEKLSQK